MVEDARVLLPERSLCRTCQKVFVRRVGEPELRQIEGFCLHLARHSVNPELNARIPVELCTHYLPGRRGESLVI